MSTIVVTLASAARLEHVRRQQESLAGTDVDRIVVWLDAGTDAASELVDLGAHLVHVPRTAEGRLRLAAARNAGARAALAAGADLIVFLDADCLPGPELLERYRAAAAEWPDALLAGPVTYLPAGAGTGPEELVAATAPHPARPDPAPGELVVGDRYELFWSLSFALTGGTWERIGGFDERYEGYGGEDTDFALRAREAGVPLVWVGGAHAYHQHHPTQSPPVQHLDDILRNGAIFAATWGEWPMRGWLDAFEASGLIRRTATGYART